MTDRIDDAGDAAPGLSIHGARRAAVLAARVAARTPRRAAAQCMLLRLLRRRTRWPRAGRSAAWVPVSLYWGRAATMEPGRRWEAPGRVPPVTHRHSYTALAAGGATAARTTVGAPAIPARIDVRPMTPLRPLAWAATPQPAPSIQRRIVAPGLVPGRGRLHPDIGRIPATFPPARATAAAPARQAALQMAFFAGTGWRGHAAPPAGAGSVHGALSTVAKRAAMARSVAPAPGAHPQQARAVSPRAGMGRIGMPATASRPVPAPSGRTAGPGMAPGLPPLVRPGRAEVAAHARSPRGRFPAVSSWPGSQPRAVELLDVVQPAAVARPTVDVAWGASGHAPRLAHATRHGAVASVAGPRALRPPLELVWTARAPDRKAAEPAHRIEAAPSKMPPAATSVSVAPAQPEPGRTRDDALARAAALDPLLTNRLADEVMRRLDRRARIERERRGN